MSMGKRQVVQMRGKTQMCFCEVPSELTIEPGFKSRGSDIKVSRLTDLGLV